MQEAGLDLDAGPKVDQGPMLVPRTSIALALGLLSAAVLLSASPPARAADPDPTNAIVLGATATLLPIGLGTSLLLTGRREAEGVRFASALTSIGVGAAIGPSVGQFYAGAGVDVVVTLLLRTLTTGIATAGLGLTLRGDPDDRGTAIALMTLGGLPTVALAGFDVFDAASTAREARIRSVRLEPDEIRRLRGIAICGPIPCPIGGPSSAGVGASLGRPL